MHNAFSITYADLVNTPMSIASENLDILRGELLRIGALRSGAYATHDHVIRLPLDPHILVESKYLAERYYTSNLKYIILIGIGGQNLGVKAVYDALRGAFDLASDRSPKIIFLDTIDTIALHDIKELLHKEVRTKEEILISLSSKSGGTTETIVNFELLLSYLRRHIEGIDERIVVTTDGTSSLQKVAAAMGYGILEMPKMVGGRFSIFSQAGIFPLLLAGIDVVSFQEGARAVLEAERLYPDANQTAKYAAETLFREIALRHISILNIFHFHPELESLGKWERQLIAESLGKEKDLSGREVHQGITPIVSIGSTDLHSMAQLYFGGPKDKFTMLIRANISSSERVPKDGVLRSLAPNISEKSPIAINDAIFNGVQHAYHKNQLPVATIHLPSISAYAIGAYMEWRMLVVVYLAALLHLDPYDQPNVEDYKEATRKILAESDGKK